MSDYKESNCVGISNFESKVVYAVSRLQNSKGKKGKKKRINGVTNKQVVDYLNKNCPYLDGDIESQVTTALLSCVKNGIVCILNDGKYRLVGPNSKSMVSNCMTRTSHGSKCKCFNIINLMSKIYPNACCSLKWKKKSPPGNINKMLRKTQKSKRRRRNKSRQICKAAPVVFHNYASRSLNILGMDSKKEMVQPCKNCIQDEPLIAREKILRRIPSCLIRKIVVPPDKFSPSEENK